MDFSFLYSFQTAFGAKRTYTLGMEGSFTRVKRPERETDYSPSPSAEVKNGRLHDMVLN
jgi:hypothetical protein